VDAGIVLLGAGRADEAERHLLDARRTFTELGSPRDVAWCDMGLGDAARLRGHDDEALRLYAAAREVFEREGDTTWASQCPTGPGTDLALAHEHGG
jgi:hypothetical protein